MTTIQITFAIFFILPIVTLIHELGHVCIAKLLGCRIKRIVIGKGKSLLKLGCIEIRRFYFDFGWYETYDLADKKSGRVMVHIGGVLFNLISLLVAVLLVYNNMIESHWTLRIFILTSTYVIIASLLPITYGGMNSDGKQIYQTVKYGKSVFRITKDE